MKTRTARRSRASSDDKEENACFTHSEVTSVENTRSWGYSWLAKFKIRFLLIPQVFSADAAGDLPDGEHHHAAGKVHHGQGEPAEGGADKAGAPDPAAQCGAVPGHAPVQVSGGGPGGGVGLWSCQEAWVWKTDPPPIRTSRPTTPQGTGWGPGTLGCP